MSKYSDFKEFSAANIAPQKRKELFAKTVDNDSSWDEMDAEIDSGSATSDSVSDAIVAIAYADHCTQALQSELEAVKAENEAIKAELATYKKPAL